MKVNLLYFFFFLFLASCSSQEEPYIPPDQNPDNPPVDEVISHENAKEIFDLINYYYSANDEGLLNESYPQQNGDPEYSYLWPYVGYVDGSAMLAKIGYGINYPGIVDNFEKYFTEGMYGNDIGAYSSSTNGTRGQGTRFFDDNAIVGLSLIEAYEITEQKKYLTRAERIIPFLTSGEDDKLGGGIWWNEDQVYHPDANSDKGISTNGFAALFLLRYSRYSDDVQQKNELISKAKNLYQWVRTTLYDSGNNTYSNSIDANGNINHTRWTYNSGVMIQVGIELFKITGEQTYIEDAIITAQGSFDYFVKPRNGLPLAYPDHDPWFNVKLSDAYIDIAPHYSNAKTFIQTYLNFINHGYKHARTDEGFYYEDWTGTHPKRYHSLLMQASVVESYGALSIFYKENYSD